MRQLPKDKALKEAGVYCGMSPRPVDISTGTVYASLYKYLACENPSKLLHRWYKAVGGRSTCPVPRPYVRRAWWYCRRLDHSKSRLVDNGYEELHVRKQWLFASLLGRMVPWIGIVGSIERSEVGACSALADM